MAETIEVGPDTPPTNAATTGAVSSTTTKATRLRLRWGCPRRRKTTAMSAGQPLRMPAMPTMIPDTIALSRVSVR